MSHIISTPVARLSRRAPSARTGTLALAAATATTLVSWLVARRFAALDVRLHRLAVIAIAVLILSLAGRSARHHRRDQGLSGLHARSRRLSFLLSRAAGRPGA